MVGHKIETTLHDQTKENQQNTTNRVTKRDNNERQTNLTRTK